MPRPRCRIYDVSLLGGTGPDQNKLLPGMTPHTFIADSGATCHMGPSDAGMYDFEDNQSKVRFGTGALQPATKVGKRPSEVIQQDGTKVPLLLQDYKQVPNMWTNFSV